MKLSVSQLREHLHQIINDNVNLVIANKPQKGVELIAVYGNSINQYKALFRVTQGAKIEILEVMADDKADLFFATADDVFSFVANEIELRVPVLFITYK